jgi:hypothetical protein
MRVADSLFESPDKGFTAVEAESVACAPPQEHIPDGLFGSLESLFAFTVPHVFLSNAQCGQCLSCLQAAGHHQLIATL